MQGGNMTQEQRFEKVLGFISDFFSMDEPDSNFARVIRDLMESCPECVIVGGIALSFYIKNPRTTQDIDIVILQPTSYGDRFKEHFDKIPDKPFTMRHKDTSIEVDILTQNHSMINLEILELVPTQFNLIEQGGTKVKVVKPELLVGLKLGRAVNNTKLGLQDRVDILSLLNDNPNLNLEKITPLLSEEERDMLDDLLSFGEEILDE